MDYANFIDAVNMMTSLTKRQPVEEKEDITLTELNVILSDIERELEVVKDREEQEAKERELEVVKEREEQEAKERELEVVKEREMQQKEEEWEREECEENDFCMKLGVYIVYNGPQVYTYQPTPTGGRIIVSIRGRYHVACVICGGTSTKLREGVCKVCDLGLTCTMRPTGKTGWDEEMEKWKRNSDEWEKEFEKCKRMIEEANESMKRWDFK